MRKPLSKLYKPLVIALLLSGSVLVMVVYKQQIEMERSAASELRFNIGLTIFVLTLSYVVFSFLFEKWKQYRQLKNDHYKTQLALLKNRIDPHFFFNTLNNLYGLAIEQSEETGPAILKLADMMRYTIYKGEQEQVTVREEMDYVKQYIDIHRLRHQPGVKVDISEHIGNPGSMIAPLLFISPVENAFKHGVEKLTEGAYIKVSLHAVGKSVRFDVENNFLPSEEKSEGMGLHNLKERLNILYPEAHTLLINEKNGIFKVSLEIHQG
ncbi:sensor histidine kinase [Roseivirga sp. BDSF3-8]|uniref:sensor histidine kinase n=1 Tax=Roseivirga sp. BDSF3-8 TaxID=3241598 RepID=UPI003531FEC4